MAGNAAVSRGPDAQVGSPERTARLPDATRGHPPDPDPARLALTRKSFQKLLPSLLTKDLGSRPKKGGLLAALFGITQVHSASGEVPLDFLALEDFDHVALADI